MNRPCGTAMSNTPLVVGVAGSLRDESYSRVALNEAVRAANSAGARTESIDLHTRDIPLFNPDRDTPPSVDEITLLFREADSILLATPMYHGSFSSPLKTIIDYAGFDEFENKTIGLLGVSGGNFPITALEHLRSVCRALNAWVIPYQAAIPKAYQHIEEGEITNDEYQERVARLGERAVQFANIEADPTSFESDQNTGARD